MSVFKKCEQCRFCDPDQYCFSPIHIMNEQERLQDIKEQFRKTGNVKRAIERLVFELGRELEDVRCLVGSWK